MLYALDFLNDGFAKYVCDEHCPWNTKIKTFMENNSDYGKKKGGSRYKNKCVKPVFRSSKDEISEVVMYLNKITESTFDKLSKKIIVLCEKNKLCDVFKNEFFSKLCANVEVNDILVNVYVDILLKTTQYFCLKNMIVARIYNYIKNIGTTEDISPKDYERFCDSQKVTKKWKNFINFAMFLYKKEYFTNNFVIDIVRQMNDLLLQSIDEPSKSMSTKEASDILRLILIMKDVTQIDYIKDTIMPNIIKLSNMKHGDHVNLTNKCIFQFKDIVDAYRK